MHDDDDDGSNDGCREGVWEDGWVDGLELLLGSGTKVGCHDGLSDGGRLTLGKTLGQYAFVGETVAEGSKLED